LFETVFRGYRRGIAMRVGSVVINVAHMERAIAFWTQALGYVLRDPDADNQTFAVLRPPERDWCNVSLQLSRAPKSGVNRVHLDLYADDQVDEVSRLEGLGATRVEPWPYADEADYVVMADPDGNEFCVVQKR
jgi:catechol 2,3-dioxygenase-like lactoylglutathione lyase family enzyme